jgi:hypothetical protein
MLCLSVVVNWLEGFLRHDCFHLLKADGSVVVAINTTIEREGVWVIWQSAVRMTVKMPRTVMALVPNPHGVVAEGDVLTVDFDFTVAVRVSEKLVSISPSEAVVISFEENDFSFEAFDKHIKHEVFPSKGKVAQMINEVVVADDAVPIFNEGVVHFHCVGEWPIAILDDVCVVEVSI